MVVKVSKPEINVREKISELDKPSGLAGQAILAAETPQEQFNLIGAGRRNIIINGNFIVSQRGNYTSSSSPSDGDFTVDRWQVVQDGSPSTALIQNSDGSMKLTAGAATTGSMRLRQKFEYDLFPRQYDNKTFILSAKIKSNSQNARLNVYAGGYLAISGVTSHSGSGQYETLTAIFTTPATIATEFSVHIGIDGVNSANTAISTGEYFEVKEVQLELGKVATPFEHRSYGEELALCQRYFERYYPAGQMQIYNESSTSNHKWIRIFHTIKRSAPSLAGSSGIIGKGTNGLGNISSLTRQGGSINEMSIRVGMSGSSGTANAIYHFDPVPGSSYFDLDCEL